MFYFLHFYIHPSIHQCTLIFYKLFYRLFKTVDEIKKKIDFSFVQKKKKGARGNEGGLKMFACVYIALCIVQKKKNLVIKLNFKCFDFLLIHKICLNWHDCHHNFFCLPRENKLHLYDQFETFCCFNIHNLQF